MTEEQVYANLAVRVPPDVMRELRRLKMGTGDSINQIVVDMLEKCIKERMGKAEVA